MFEFTAAEWALLVLLGGPIIISWVTAVFAGTYNILDRWLDRSRNSIKDKVTSGDE